MDRSNENLSRSIFGLLTTALRACPPLLLLCGVLWSASGCIRADGHVPGSASQTPIAKVVQVPKPSPDEQALQRIRNSEDVNDYVPFLRQFPTSPYRDEVQALLDRAVRHALEDKASWWVKCDYTKRAMFLKDAASVLTNQATLKVLAERTLIEGDNYVQASVVHSLEDQRMLTEIAKRGILGSHNRFKAMQKITEQSLLAEVVIPNLEDLPDLSIASLYRITDPNVLREVETNLLSHAKADTSKHPRASLSFTAFFHQLARFRRIFYEEIHPKHPDVHLDMKTSIKVENYGPKEIRGAAVVVIMQGEGRKTFTRGYQTSFPLRIFSNFSIDWMAPPVEWEKLLMEVREWLGEQVPLS